MADSKISALSAVTTPLMTDQHPVNQGGTTKRETNQQIYDLFSNDVFGFDVQAIIRNPLLGYFVATDFAESSLLFASNTASSGAVTRGSYGEDNTSKAIGVIRCSTGAVSAVGRAQYRISPNQVSFPLVRGKVLLISRVAPEALSTSAEEFEAQSPALCNSISVSGMSGFYWSYARSIDGDFWSTNTYKPSTLTKNVTSIPVTTSYIWLAIVVNSNWTEAKFYYSTDGINWILAATHTTNIPTVTNLPYLTAAQVQKSVGTSARFVSCDFFMAAIEFTR